MVTIYDENLGHWTGPWKWLLLFGTDGHLWRTRVHAEYNGATHMCKTWITSKERDSGEGENPTLEIVDWLGKKWKMDISPSIPNDSIPYFKMTLSNAK